jgi:hypothetical protein
MSLHSFGFSSNKPAASKKEGIDTAQKQKQNKTEENRQRTFKESWRRYENGEERKWFSFGRAHFFLGEFKFSCYSPGWRVKKKVNLQPC